MMTIYVLIDPRNYAVRYVGITDDVYMRFAQHVHCDGSNPRKDAWIAELKSCQAMLIMKTLETVETAEQARERETYWIHHYLFLKADLLNSLVPAICTHPASMKNGKHKSERASIQEAVLSRHNYGTWPAYVTPSWQEKYEFLYFTVPRPSEMSNAMKYAEHEHEYKRGQEWINAR